MVKIVVYIFWILSLIKCIYCEFNYSATDTLDTWFNQLNYQYKVLSHYSEYYKWEINVNLQKNMQNDFNELIENWSNWKQKKCIESKFFLNELTTSQQRMIFMLCRGPNYINAESKEVVNNLEKIKECFRETQICLPKDFDLCTNYLKIWDYTIVRDQEGFIFPINRTRITTNSAYKGLLDHHIPLTCLDIKSNLKDVIFEKFANIQRDNCQIPNDLIPRWTWESSRVALSQQQIDLPKVVNLMNIGANRNGYHDIGECWREDLEMHDLNEIVDELWSKTKPFYQLLHGVLRNSLQKKYSGQQIFTEKDPLPAHLLDNKSLSNWESFLDLLMPLRKVKLEENFSKKNWTTLDMVKRAEDFYASISLSRMTGSFWKSLNLSNTGNDSKCRDSFANMFDGTDFRLNLCVDQSLNGFYKIINLMGYIEYNMNFKDQPDLFQNPTNTAFGEAIGNVIYLGMITPQHLNRLTLLPDKFLSPNKIPTQINKSKLSYFFDGVPKTENLVENITRYDELEGDYPLHIIQIDTNFPKKLEVDLNDFDLSLLLRMALTKIPKISFEYVMDTVRWNLLSNKVNFTNVNDYFWHLINKEQGIYPINIKNQPNFIDQTANIHIINNIPYVPYFLSSFLEVQIFKGLCEYTIFGGFNRGKKIPMPLHRCDIYGSKRAGKLLKKAMSLGSSVHWSEVLYILTGQTKISPIPLLEYYEPLIIWLEKIVIKNDIPLGW